MKLLRKFGAWACAGAALLLFAVAAIASVIIPALCNASVACSRMFDALRK